MSQNVWDTIISTSTSGNQLATLLNDFKDAVVSGMSGTARPPELQAGGMWVDITNDGIGTWDLKIFDSTNDITILTIDKNIGAAAVNSAVGSFEILKGSDDTVGPILKLTKERIAGGGQTLDGDILGQLNVYGTTAAGANTIQFQMEVVSTDNTDPAAKGSRFVIRGVNEGSGALVEYIRVIDGKFAVGTTTPEQIVDVEGNIQSKKTIESAAGTSVILKKARVNTNGQTLSGDNIGSVDFKGVDETGSVVSVASVDTTLGENTTTTTRGSTVTIKNTVVGEASPTNAVVINDNIALNRDTNITGALDVTGAVTFDETVYVADDKLVSVDDLTVRGILTANEVQAGTVTEIEDPNIVLNKGGNQSSANTNTSGFTVEMSDATDFKVGYDSTKASKLVAGEVGSLKEIVNVDSAQNLSNKAIIDPTRTDVKKDTLANLTTYATTADNGQWCFATDTKEMYQVLDGVLEIAGSGAGVGGFNYVDNSDFKNNIDGTSTSDAVNFAISYDATLKFRTAGALKLTKAASDQSGEYIVLADVQIADFDKSKMLSYSFEGDLSDADVATGDFEAQIWESADGITYSYLHGSRAELQGVASDVKIDFQTTQNAYYQLRIVCITTDATEVIAWFKNIVIGPQEPSTTGTIHTDFETFTGLTWRSGYTFTTSALMARDGQNAKFNIKATVIIADATSLYFDLDTLTIDTGAMGFSGSGFKTFGHAELRTSAGIVKWQGLVGISVATPSRVYVYYYRQDSTTHIDEANVNSTTPDTMSATDSLEINFEVPILGWSSNMVLSSQTSNREIKFNGSQSSPVLGVVANFNATTVNDDTAGMWNGLTQEWTLPEDGEYLFTGGWIGANTNAEFAIEITYLYWNGSVWASIAETDFRYRTAATTGTRRDCPKFMGKRTFPKGTRIKMQYTGTAQTGASLVAGITKLNTGSQTIGLQPTERFYTERVASTNFGATNVTDDIVSLTLPEGNYLISGGITVFRVASTVWSDTVRVSISSSSAPLTPAGYNGASNGFGHLSFEPSSISSTAITAQNIAPIYVSLSSTTTIYLSARAGWSSGGIPTNRGYLQAIKVNY